MSKTIPPLEKIMKTAFGAVCLCGVVLLAGCGEQTASETQKAVDQIKVETEKLATQKVETLRTEALGQLKKLGGEKPDEKGSEAKHDGTSVEKSPEAGDDRGASAPR
jgi:hypothetical protein